MAEPRRTVRSLAVVEGPGLFGGAPARVELLPAAAGEGLVLELGGSRAPATIASVDERAGERNTVLRVGGATFATVEHVLSALAGLGITDAIIRASGPEAPFADASAAPWVAAILGAGVEEIGAIEPLRPTVTVRAEDRAGAWIEAEPCDPRDASWEYRLDYAGAIPAAVVRLAAAALPGAYVREIAPARTFCLAAEAAALRAAGLCGHLTERDVLVFDGGRPEGNRLRWPDEPARHKLLDLMGDLMLLGRPLAAHVVSSKGGHALTRALVRRLAGM